MLLYYSSSSSQNYYIRVSQLHLDSWNLSVNLFHFSCECVWVNWLNNSHNWVKYLISIAVVLLKWFRCMTAWPGLWEAKSTWWPYYESDHNHIQSQTYTNLISNLEVYLSCDSNLCSLTDNASLFILLIVTILLLEARIYCISGMMDTE